VYAWYQASGNAINFPLSTLQSPFFDPEWPTSMNYGALGSVMGHELTHGFDDGGVQWDGIGKVGISFFFFSSAKFKTLRDPEVKKIIYLK
jgi:putative endopeptidase